MHFIPKFCFAPTIQQFGANVVELVPSVICLLHNTSEYMNDTDRRIVAPKITKKQTYKYIEPNSRHSFAKQEIFMFRRVGRRRVRELSYTFNEPRGMSCAGVFVKSTQQFANIIQK